MTETAGIRVPQSIAKQGKAAEELIRQRSAGLETQDTGDPGPETPHTPEAPPVEDGEVAVEPDELETDTPPEQPDPPKGDEWEQKYRALKGKYDAEVPRLWGQVRQAQEENQDLKSQIQTLEDRVQEMQSAPPSQGGPAGNDFNPEDFSDYGEEFVRLAKQNQVLQQELAELKKGFETVSTETTQSRQRQQEDDFFASVERSVPNWTAQNHDSEFIGWLSNIEPISGQPYQALLAQARQDLNAQRAAGIFLRFREESGKQYAHAQQQQPEKEPASQKIPTPSVAPPKSRSTGAPSETGQGKSYTKDDISRFYRDAAFGKYSDADKKRIEKDIFQANRDGRIR